MSANAEIGFVLGGLRCAGCAARVERELRAAPGVSEAAVNFAGSRALVRFDPGQSDVAALATRIESLGYVAHAFDPAASVRPAPTHEARLALARLLVAAFLAGNVMVISFALYFGALGDIDAGLRRGLRALALCLSLPALSWCAAPFWRGAWAGARRRELTLDVPIVLGISTAFVATALGTLREARDVFSDSAATIVFLMLLGRTLERSARARASAAIDALAARAPRRALRRERGALAEVDVEALLAGDRVVVPAGQRLPVDGRLLSPAADLDESLLTGEALPATRRAGELVNGGVLNLSSELELEVTRPASQGTIARLVGLLERAQAQRPELQRAVDRVAAWFAPAVLAVAAATCVGAVLAGSSGVDAALRGAAVLIVACPCALGLGTPAAVAAALGRGAQLGLWFKSGAALERASRIARVLIDKTGTLTWGRLELRQVLCAPTASPERVLELAADALGASSHPIADAVRRAASSRGLAPAGPAERLTLPGLGVEAGALACGSRELLERRGVALDASLAAAATAAREAGDSLAFVADGGKAVGALVLGDSLRPFARAAIQSLGRAGVSCALVSGDDLPAVRRAADAADIGEAIGRATPESKLERVRSELERGVHVAFAGDGINDAAALAAAELGFAFARGSDVTVEAADVVSHDPDLRSLPTALALGRAAMRRIRENLALAVAYNAIAVPLAIAGVIGPLSAALAMSGSSLVVTANALRLQRFGSTR
ncbi:MAG TPA: cation-translocating P-type ATPase [Myxococcota bacterium]|nr:cation-translocating P-type ATPase [Myxococcota bacterium]